MSNREILEKAIQKAIDSGFNPGPAMNSFNTWSGESDMLEPQQLFTKNMLQDLFFRHSLLFNHDFAKALWGEDTYYEGKSEDGAVIYAANGLAKWKHRLQQMVIADDPIAYLGEHI